MSTTHEISSDEELGDAVMLDESGSDRESLKEDAFQSILTRIIALESQCI